MSARPCLAALRLLVARGKVTGIVISVIFASRRVERFGAGLSILEERQLIRHRISRYVSLHSVESIGGPLRSSEAGER